MKQKVVNFREIKAAGECCHDGVSLGEVMLRLDPFDVPTARAAEMRVFQGGGETKVGKNVSFDIWLDVYENTVKKVAKDFPNLSLIGTQWRGAHDADLISWAAVLYDVSDDKFYRAPVRENIPIKDRTGGGDSFTSGVLAAILKGHNLETAVQWGAAHGILVQETPGDITMIHQEDVLLAEVKRGRTGGEVKAAR